MIVDDDSVLGHLYKNAFTYEGFEVSVAMDGEEALELVKSEKPDLILTDTMMPKIDGLELLKKLKSKAATKKIPVIVMSNLANEEDVQAALKAGAVRHISKKEFGPKEVVSEVKGVLGRND